jgi:lipoate-protein ligase A
MSLPDVDIIVDSAPSSGRFNMAMDAALLELGAERDRSVLRIYEWSEPTVSVGYFQSAHATDENPFPQLPCVRRLTGGGAILHDRELTYSCVVPPSHPVRQSPSDLYAIVHKAVIGLLYRCNVASQLRSEWAPAPVDSEDPSLEPATVRAGEPFLCFLRANPNDIVHQSGIKITGSAQRRRRGVTLQHGSILLSASRVIPELPGISDLCPRFDAPLFRRELPIVIAQAFAHCWTFRDYTNREREMADTTSE